MGRSENLHDAARYTSGEPRDVTVSRRARISAAIRSGLASTALRIGSQSCVVRAEVALVPAYSDLREAMSIEKRYFTSDLASLS